MCAASCSQNSSSCASIQAASYVPPRFASIRSPRNRASFEAQFEPWSAIVKAVAQPALIVAQPSLTVLPALIPSPGTRVDIRADDVPAGISAEDHAAGLASSLANLATYLEQ